MSHSDTACLRTRSGDPVLLEHVGIDGAIAGLLLKVSVAQRFRNPCDRHVEIVYTFPLPFGAVLLGVDVRLGERELRGAVVEKRQAAQDYEDSLAAGDCAIMLEQNHDRSYSLNLGNLAAGETCLVTMRYAETLQFEQRGLRVCIPTVIAPRFGDAVRDARLAPQHAAAPSLHAHHPFDLTLRLPPELTRARIGSPSHALASQMVGDGVTLSLAQAGSLDRDFVLVLEDLAQDSFAIAAPDTTAPGRSAALASFCPRIAAAAPLPVVAKLLVDCSGSMAGDSIAAARRALQAIVDKFDARDRFSLSRFGSTVEHRARGLWAVTERTRLAARRWVGALDATLGGTEMEAALASTFTLGANVRADVLLVTDGQIHAIDGVLATAKASGHRLFIVAIGSSPAESHLRRLALATGGACDFVAPGERVEPAVLRMFARLRSPRLNRLRVSWPAGGWTSALPEAVFDGDTVNLYAQLEGDAGGTVRLYGCDGDCPEREIACAVIAPASGEAHTLARMAASARAAAPGVPQEEAPSLALDYQLVTERTNFLLVHERADADKPADMPPLLQVAPMLPAGWAGAGSVVTRGGEGFRQPAVWRRLDAGGDALCVASSVPAYDVPAFFRRSGSETMGAEGLTPLGLHELLRAMPKPQWPRSYADLRGIGLGAAIVDWLELVMGAGQDEPDVVAAFLFVMCADDIRTALRQPRMASVRKLITRLLAPSAAPAEAGDAEAALAERIAESLADMTASDWPPCVFALETSGAGCA
ncbi:VIT domain-containing protein [Massilia sp. R2A-15]|uniref:VIT domain-containing protein n=1 Tax=Massilia sp. R2A-15 TaxID=3064278 RepID=UPI002732BCE7|nr:VIT domain-containing protein [Massilia sp. R2A-15]WLI87686.1 VIT domain-containing protein [Massilia sp. R2A-15]